MKTASPVSPETSGKQRPALPEIIRIALSACPEGSDIFFSPGRPVQVSSGSALVAIDVPGIRVLSAEDTASIAVELLGEHTTAAAKTSTRSGDVAYPASQ